MSEIRKTTEQKTAKRSQKLAELKDEDLDKVQGAGLTMPGFGIGRGKKVGPTAGFVPADASDTDL